ncbi:uncharacterized protein LOC135073453 [Ostrinia nubilalis]|uniref:uncharacterized protein LOC135073453 n=1 Tax=Ostrinia nubilalis TaxID=29057 RepID=UPI00308257D8
MDVRLLLLFSLLTGADFQETVEAECCSNDVDGTQQDTADQTTEVAEFQDLLELEAACPELSGQIIGGRPSSVTRHPYQVSMVLNGNSFCGGFIISPSYVLTAAHCVQNVSPNAIRLRVGSTRRDSGGRIVRVANVTVHPRYGQPQYDNDIAVLGLARPLVFNDAIRSIRLPQPRQAVPLARMTVTGWGLTAGWSTVHPRYGHSQYDNDIAVLGLARPLVFNDAIRSIRLPQARQAVPLARMTVTGWGLTAGWSTMHPRYGQPQYDNDIAVLGLARPLVFNDAIRSIRLPQPRQAVPLARMTVTGWGLTAGWSTMHPRYGQPQYDNDIAVLGLARPLVFNDAIRSIRLPQPRQAVPLARMTVTGWGLTAYDNDIAVLGLARPLVFNDAIRSIRLPQPRQAVPLARMTVTGWGLTAPRGRRIPRIMMEARVPVVPHWLCQLSYGDALTTNMFCGGHFLIGGVSSCQGDSGGPAVFRGTAYGVVSFARGCALPLSPTVFSNVAALRDWVTQTTGV